MVRQLVCCLLFVLLSASTAKAEDGYMFDYNQRCQQAYNAYLSMKVGEGDALIRQEFMANPHNLMATYLADYSDFLTLIFMNNPAELKQRQSHQEERQHLLDRGDDKDPWKDFCRAGVYLHWAVIHGWYGSQFKATTTFRKSYLILKSNAERFPGFEQNAIFLGMEEAAAGAIPDEYSWLAGIFGMKGNIRQGTARLGHFLDTHPAPNTPMRTEAVIYYQYIRFYLLSQQSPVWSFVNSERFPIRNNLLHCFIRANIALNSHHADVALQTLQEAAKLPGYSNFPSFDYETGNALFMRVDGNCITYYNRFLANNHGNAFIKDALMKCALTYYLQRNIAKANELRMQIGRQGAANTDADKGAQRFYKEGVWPNPMVLQLRLLTEGGYYAAALVKLPAINPQQLNATDALEYLYRAGRAYEETGDAKTAAQYYTKAINNGKDHKEQFAARAALQSGLLYEKRGQNKEALQYFNLCLSMKHHDFQASIDQQAKAGINRVGTF